MILGQMGCSSVRQQPSKFTTAMGPYKVTDLECYIDHTNRKETQLKINYNRV